LLRTRGGGIPLVIVLDDAHDADVSMLGFLAEILSASSGDLSFPNRDFFDVAEPPSDVPLLLLATSWTHRREEQLATAHGFGRWLEELKETGIAHCEFREETALSALKGVEADALYREHLPWINGEQLKDLLAHSTSDTVRPFLAMLRVAQLSESFPTRQSWESLSAEWLTSNLLRVPEDELRQRFMRLSEEAQWAVTCGALIGPEFPEHAVVSALTGFEGSTSVKGNSSAVVWSAALNGASGSAGYLSGPIKLTELPEPPYSNSFFAFDDDQAYRFAWQRGKILPWMLQAATVGTGNFLRAVMESHRSELGPGLRPAVRNSISGALSHNVIASGARLDDPEVMAFAYVLAGWYVYYSTRRHQVDSEPWDLPRMAALQNIVESDKHGIGFEYARCHLACWLSAQGKVDAAREFLHVALDYLAHEAPRSRKAVEVARRLLGLSGEVSQARLRQIEDIAVINSGTCMGDMLMLDLSAARGKVDGAADLLRPHAATNLSAALKLADLLVNRNNRLAAVVVLAPLAEKNETAALKSATLLVESNDRPAAITVLRPLAGRFANIAVRLSGLLADSKDRDGALAVLRPFASRFESAAVRLAGLLIESENRDGAVAVLLPLAARFESVALMLADMLVQAGDHSAAVATLTPLAERFENLAVWLADLLVEGDDAIGAIAVLGRLAGWSEHAALKLAELLNESGDHAGATGALRPLAGRFSNVALRLADLLVKAGDQEGAIAVLRSWSGVSQAAQKLLWLSRTHSVDADTLKWARRCAEGFAERDYHAALVLLACDTRDEPKPNILKAVRKHVKAQRSGVFAWMVHRLWSAEEVTHFLPIGSQDLRSFLSFLWEHSAETPKVPGIANWKCAGLYAQVVHHCFPTFQFAAWSRLLVYAEEHPYCATVLGSIAIGKPEQERALGLLRPHVLSGHQNSVLAFARLAISIGGLDLRYEAEAALAHLATDSEEGKELLVQLANGTI
jgi:hypothetical protein